MQSDIYNRFVYFVKMYKNNLNVKRGKEIKGDSPVNKKQLPSNYTNYRPTKIK